MRWCTLCVILHLEALEEVENKEIVMRLATKIQNLLFSAVSDTQAVPQTTPAPAPQTTPAPIVTSTGYNYPVPEIPYLSDRSVPQLPHPHQNLFPLYTEPHPPTAQAVRVEGEEDVDAVVVAASVAGYWNESCKNGAAQTNLLHLLKRVVDKYFCHFLTFFMCCMYEIQVLNFEKWGIFYYNAICMFSVLFSNLSHQFWRSYSIEVLTDKFLSGHFDTLDVTHASNLQTKVIFYASQQWHVQHLIDMMRILGIKRKYHSVVTCNQLWLCVKYESIRNATANVIEIK